MHYLDFHNEVLAWAGGDNTLKTTITEEVPQGSSPPMREYPRRINRHRRRRHCGKKVRVHSRAIQQKD